MSEPESTPGEAERRPPARLPAGEEIFAGERFDLTALERIDRVLADGRCPDGRLVFECESSRLVCLVDRGAPLLAGLIERRRATRLPLRELPLRIEQLGPTSWRLERTAAGLARATAVPFCHRPVLRSSIRLVDPAHVLEVLRQAGRDALLSFERAGGRTLLFLERGSDGRIYFADPGDDPGEGTAAERLLVFAFDPAAPAGRLEVFTDLSVPRDPDAGAPLAELAAAGQPPPPTRVVVQMKDGREVMRLPFNPPEVTIGRDPACEVFLDNLAVSRRHARIAWSRGRFLVEDLDSANGTRYRGEKVSSAELTIGGRIEIGKFEIFLMRHREQAGLSQTLLIPTRRPTSRLVLEGDGGETSLERGAIVGSGSGVDATARGWTVRPVHARIEHRGADGLWVTCFGRARVSVNGRATRSAALAPGDSLKVGRSTFTVRKLPA